MKPLSELKAKQTRLNEELQKVQEEIDASLKQTYIVCENDSFGKGCSVAAKIGNKTYIQTWWYESPSGCTGGDTWHPDEGQWKCSHCGKMNRLYNKSDIEKLSHLFKNRVNYHPYNIPGMPDKDKFTNPKGKEFKVEIF